MGKTASIGFMLAGLAAWEIAAYQAGLPDVRDFIKDMIIGLDEHPGKCLSIPFEYLGDYGREFLYNHYAKLGLAGQIITAGGLTGLVYNLFKKPEKE